MSELTLRPAAYADSPALARLQVESYRNAYAGLLPQDYLDHFTVEEQTFDWQELLAGPQDFILLVAEDENQALLGYALGHLGQTAIEGYDSELDALHVQRNAQRQGIGQALIGAMARALQTAGAESIMLWVLVHNPARGLYERLGGQLLGKRQVTLGEGDVLAEEAAFGWKRISDLARLSPQR